jgi:hypothetical protein
MQIVKIFKLLQNQQILSGKIQKSINQQTIKMNKKEELLNSLDGHKKTLIMNVNFWKKLVKWE